MKERDDLGVYPNRKFMINDLVKNYPLVGLSYSAVVDLLGKPDGISDTEPFKCYYDIELDYGFNIDPVYSKTLELQLNKDSVVAGISIDESGK